MTFSAACELLRKHNVPGYSSREAARVRIIVDGTVPHQKIGRQYYVPASEIHKLVGEQPTIDAPSEDQALLKFYQDDPANDCVKATVLGLSRSLQHAKFIYDTYQEALHDPRVLAAKREKEREAAATASASKPCASCGRMNEQSRAESAQLVQSVTGDVKSFFDMTEEIRLQEFFEHRCRECLAWRKGAPIEAMRAKLQAFAQVPKKSDDEGDLSSTPGPNGGAKTADGIESVNRDADVEEVPPLPTNSNR